MTEIEFSFMERPSAAREQLLAQLKDFEEKTSIHVRPVMIPWAKGWTEIAKFGMYGNGPDVSEVGTTWIGSLAAMQALRPFTQQEVSSLGGGEAFFDSIWRTGFLPGDPRPWAIPWTGDVRVLYYWKDALEKAKIEDPTTAFASHHAMAKTLEKLKSKYKHPFALTVVDTPTCLHEASHWLWSAGGDFISPDSRRVTFNQPAALQGWQKYFGLHPFVPPQVPGDPETTDLFIRGKAPVAVGGPWWGIAQRPSHPEWASRLGIAPLPGAAYVGGTSLVIWKHSLHGSRAYDLIRFLTSQEERFAVGSSAQYLPVRRNTMRLFSAEQSPFHHVCLQAMQTGRSFPTMRLWGSIEERLTHVISSIWLELFANPKQNIEACLHRYFDPLAERLNGALGS